MTGSGVRVPLAAPLSHPNSSDIEGAPETKAALDLLALTFARPGEVRAAEWSEFDLDRAIWSIPAAKMKMQRPHRIPLAPRAVTLLRELHNLTGNGRFVFPSNRSRQRCMSENTINAALRRLGFSKDEMTARGFISPEWALQRSARRSAKSKSRSDGTLRQHSSVDD
ncbi:tyrosine-type recombinase/integrase [Bradyrhizobium sp. Pha-3]|uniref:tyrosine-type recombinase/integrase n=1 Tax=Bradyrhizobium sp. Pha-3 TaxID=208375 RepID=UPI0035D3E373